MQRNRGRAWGIVLAAVVLAPAAWFSVAPTEGTSAGFQFSAAGDFGAWTGFRTTLGLLNESGSDFALAIGDLSYGGFTGYADNTTEAGWCAKFHRYFENVIILAGNHDTGAFPPLITRERTRLRGSSSSLPISCSWTTVENITRTP